VNEAREFEHIGEEYRPVDGRWTRAAEPTTELGD
jgi:hypothetical protein